MSEPSLFISIEKKNYERYCWNLFVFQSKERSYFEGDSIELDLFVQAYQREILQRILLISENC